MPPGIVILVLAVVVAVGFGLHRLRVDGAFGAGVPGGRGGRAAAGDPGGRGGRAATVTRPTPPTTWSAIAAAVPAATPGQRATLVQFSSAFCAPCRTTRVVLADVADHVEGVVHLEVDAEQHLALVRELGVRRTPTTLVLDADGREVTRAAGAPRREQVLAALPAPDLESR